MPKEGLFLLFEYVHLIKSIRNNWITEKSQELECEFQNQKFTAKWKSLVDLYDLEKQEIVKLSPLYEVSVFP